MSATPSYSVRAVAERIGVPTATLRSWNRRYGVGPPEHLPGRHRLYSESDIAVVLRMRELISQGVSPRSAAQSVTGSLPTGADPAALLKAAYALDVVAASRIVDDLFRVRGVPDTWDHVILPAFADIVARQLSEGRCIDVEHALSWTVSRALQARPVGGVGPTTVLACLEGEHHSLPLEALRAALGERGCAALMLGATVPTSAVLDALSHQDEEVRVVLWAHSAQTADVDAVRAVRASAAKVLVAGPGWAGVDDAFIQGATRVDSLRAALEQLVPEESVISG